MLKHSFMSLKLCTILQNYKTLHTLLRAIYSYKENYRAMKGSKKPYKQRAIQPAAQILLHSTLKAPITSLIYSNNRIPGPDAVNCCGRTIQI